MGIFDALTGAAGHEAAGNQRNVLAALIPNLATAGQDAYRSAGDALRTGFTDAQGNLLTGYNAATGAINNGASGALSYLSSGNNDALARLDQARGGFGALSDLAGNYGKGAALYSDALGINGPEGNARATAAFTPSLAYNFNLDQGLNAINRSRNARGMLNSGNTDRDAQTFGSGLASNEVKGWLDRLSGFNPLQLSATQGAAQGNAGIDTTAALLDSNNGRSLAGVATGQGSALADLASRAYGGLAGLNTGQGGALANNLIGGAQNWQNTFGQAIPQYNDTFKQDAKASNDASANVINLGVNLAKLGAGAAGGLGIPGAAGGSFGGIGGNLGVGGAFDPSMWNKSLPVNGFNWG